MKTMAGWGHDQRAAAGEYGAPYALAGIGTERTHAVQFYEDDSFLVRSVGDYLASGLAVGQPVIAVLTEPHRREIRDHLERRGFDLDRASLLGLLTIVDTHELLALFMDGPDPNAERCRMAVGGMLRIHENRGHSTVRVFGEMVDVLCREGNFEGALALEAIWNDLARTHRFSLLCAYSMRTLANDALTASVASICEAHRHVLPTETYLNATAPDQLREIAMLQQRAQSLAAEVERREALERSLRDALWRAESANRAKNQFLATMSHELRTPLNAIGGHVQLVEMELLGPINDKQRDALGRVQRNQRHLLGLINDVLNLARAEASQLVYAEEVVPVVALLREVTSVLAALIGAKGITAVVESDDDQVSARCDREKVQQVLLNLVANAIKFTPAGGRITLGATRQAGPAPTIAIAVSDTGVGVPTAKLEAIFDPFTQVSSQGNCTGNHGVGLGLAVSRTLARGMCGDLIAHSTAGAGATFTLTLPAA